MKRKVAAASREFPQSMSERSGEQSIFSTQQGVVPGVLHRPMRDFRILKSVKKKRPVEC